MQACMHFCMQLGRCTVPVASLTILEPDLGFMMDNSHVHCAMRCVCVLVQAQPLRTDLSAASKPPISDLLLCKHPFNQTPQRRRLMQRCSPVQ